MVRGVFRLAVAVLAQLDDALTDPQTPHSQPKPLAPGVRRSTPKDGLRPQRAKHWRPEERAGWTFVEEPEPA